MAGQNRVSHVLPSARVIPHLTVCEDVKDRLTEIAAKAYRRSHGDFDTEPSAVILAPVSAGRAAEFYVSEKEFETTLPAFRKMLTTAGSLSKKAPGEAIQRYCDLVGTTSDAVPPFAQMRALFCYGDPHSNGLESDDADETKRQCEREDVWAATLSPKVLCNEATGHNALREGLRQWLSLARELHEMTGKGRSPIAAEISFVATLAHYWRHELRAVPGNSRAEDSYTDSDSRQQRGLFADFVRLSAEIIPAEYRPRSGWDHAIRCALERVPK